MAEQLGEYAVTERVISQLHANAIDLLDREGAAKWTARWIDVTVRAGDRRCEADALGQSTWPLLWQPNFTEALPILARAAQICQECGLTPGLMVVEMNIAEFYVKLGAFDAAISRIERGAGAYTSVAPVFAEKARGNLIMPFTYSGRPAEAVTLGREGLRMTERSENIYAREERLRNLAEAEYASGEIERRDRASRGRRRAAAADVFRAGSRAVRRTARGIPRAGRRLHFGADARCFRSDEVAGAFGRAIVAATFGVVHVICVSRLWG